jgi:hypothetical protein
MNRLVKPPKYWQTPKAYPPMPKALSPEAPLEVLPLAHRKFFNDNAGRTSRRGATDAEDAKLLSVIVSPSSHFFYFMRTKRT